MWTKDDAWGRLGGDEWGGSRARVGWLGSVICTQVPIIIQYLMYSIEILYIQLYSNSDLGFLLVSQLSLSPTHWKPPAPSPPHCLPPSLHSLPRRTAGYGAHTAGGGARTVSLQRQISLMQGGNGQINGGRDQKASLRWWISQIHGTAGRSTTALQFQGAAMEPRCPRSWWQIRPAHAPAW